MYRNIGLYFSTELWILVSCSFYYSAAVRHSSGFRLVLEFCITRCMVLFVIYIYILRQFIFYIKHYLLWKRNSEMLIVGIILWVLSILGIMYFMFRTALIWNRHFVVGVLYRGVTCVTHSHGVGVQVIHCRLFSCGSWLGIFVWDSVGGFAGRGSTP